MRAAVHLAEGAAVGLAVGASISLTVGYAVGLAVGAADTKLFSDNLRLWNNKRGGKHLRQTDGKCGRGKKR